MALHRLLLPKRMAHLSESLGRPVLVRKLARSVPLPLAITLQKLSLLNTEGQLSGLILFPESPKLRYPCRWRCIGSHTPRGRPLVLGDASLCEKVQNFSTHTLDDGTAQSATAQEDSPLVLGDASLYEKGQKFCTIAIGNNVAQAVASQEVRPLVRGKTSLDQKARKISTLAAGNGVAQDVTFAEDRLLVIGKTSLGEKALHHIVAIRAVAMPAIVVFTCVSVVSTRGI